MPVLNEDGAAADDSDSRQRCSCLPFCLWGASGSGGRPNKSGGAQAKKRRRRRSLRFRLRLSWPWFRKSGNEDAGEGGGDDSSEKGKKRRRSGRRLLLLLTTSLQPKKALASVVSGDSALLPVPAKVRRRRRLIRSTVEWTRSIDRVMGARDRSVLRRDHDYSPLLARSIVNYFTVKLLISA